MKNRTIPDLWENIRSPIKQWKEMRDSPLGYANITREMMDRFRRDGCQSSSTNYGEEALRINDVNALDSNSLICIKYLVHKIIMYYIIIKNDIMF